MKNLHWVKLVETIRTGHQITDYVSYHIAHGETHDAAVTKFRETGDKYRATINHPDISTTVRFYKADPEVLSTAQREEAITHLRGTIQKDERQLKQLNASLSALTEVLEDKRRGLATLELGVNTKTCVQITSNNGLISGVYDVTALFVDNGGRWPETIDSIAQHFYLYRNCMVRVSSAEPQDCTPLDIDREGRFKTVVDTNA